MVLGLAMRMRNFVQKRTLKNDKNSVISLVIEGGETWHRRLLPPCKKMMESLPEDTQNQVVEHLRDYIEEMKDNEKWDYTFKNTQAQLVTAARRTRKEIADSRAKPLNHREL